MMAEIFLTYLNFWPVKGLPGGTSPDPRDMPLLKHSFLYWGTHTQMELSDGANTFVLELLDQFDNHIFAKFLWELVSGGLPIYYTPGRKPFSTLHCVSYFGIAEIASAL